MFMNEIELKLRENRRKRLQESRLREGYYLVSYNYDGDALSDYRSTMLVKASSEEEALEKARAKKSDGRHFEIDRSQKEFPDGYVDSLKTWRSKYPKSNYDIEEGTNTYSKKSSPIKEYIWDEDDEANEYKKLRSKSVLDSDGFYTDYTLYLCPEGHYICILGDNDIYHPEDTEPDVEFDDESEALDWFDNYEGFADEYDESKKTTIRAKHTPTSTANKPQINEAFVESEAILQGLTKVRTEAREAYSQYANMQDLAECKATLTYLVKDSKTLLDLVNDILTGKSVEESQINEASKDKLTLEDLKNATYSSSFMDDRAWVKVDGHRYVKIGPDKWEYHSLQSNVLGGTYSSEVLYDEIIQATKVDYDLYLKSVNEASSDDEEDDWDFDDEEESTVYSNWGRLKDLQGDFWTRLNELIEYIEDQLGYEVVYQSREYLSIIDPKATDDAEYKISLGGTENTIVVDLDRSYPM